MISKEDLKTPEGKTKFINDFIFIHSKNPEVRWEDQVNKLKEYDWWLKETPILEKVKFLDSLDDDQLDQLASIWIWFAKWIDTASFITSLDIRSEFKPTTEEPCFRQPEILTPPKKPIRKRGAVGSPVEGQPESKVQNMPTSSKPKTPEKSTSKRRSIPARDKIKETKSEKPSVVLDKKYVRKLPPGRDALTYTVKIGRYQTVTLTNKIYRPADEDEKVTKKRMELATQRGEVTTVQMADGAVLEIHHDRQIRIYQLWVFEFVETDNGVTHCKRWVDIGFNNGMYPTAENPQIFPLADTGIINEAGRAISMFIAQHQENFADELYVDAFLWSQLHPMPNFAHVKKITIRHYLPMMTQWWLKHCKTLRTIPEIKLLRNVDPNAIDPYWPEWRAVNKFKNSEAQEFVLPIRGKELGGIVEVIDYAEQPIFWAKKLKLEPCIIMNLTDIQRMFGLSELTANMIGACPEDVNNFLHTWNAGRMGHRLVRVAVEFDNADRFVNFVDQKGQQRMPALTGLDYQQITPSSKLSFELKKILVTSGVHTFVVYRNWNMPVSEKKRPTAQLGTIREGAQPPPKTAEKSQKSSSPEDEGFASGRSGSCSTGSYDRSRTHSTSTLASRQSPHNSVLPNWIGGACAIVEFKKHKDRDDFQTSFYFTAVQNEKFAMELLNLR